MHSRKNVEFQLEGSKWNRKEAQPYDLWLKKKRNAWCVPSSPYPNVQLLETNGLQNLSFNGEKQVVETGFSSNRIPYGWSRRPLFCPSNPLRLPNRKVTHGGCTGQGGGRRGNCVWRAPINSVQALGCPVAAIRMLDLLLPSRRQPLSSV